MLCAGFVLNSSYSGHVSDLLIEFSGCVLYEL